MQGVLWRVVCGVWAQGRAVEGAGSNSLASSMKNRFVFEGAEDAKEGGALEQEQEEEASLFTGT